MKCAIIAPPSMLELSGMVDEYHMVLPDQMALEPYNKFYQDCKGFKILDNGIAEGTRYDAHTLIRMARNVGANEVVVHDQLGDANSTIALVRKFKRHVDPSLGYMGVLQGKDVSEVLKCLYFYDHEEWITSIGIPRILCRLHKLQRVTLVETILKQQELGSLRPLPLHALGASEWVREVVALADTGVRGIDTSLPVVHALAGKGLDKDYEPRQFDFMKREIPRTSLIYRLAFDNVTQYLGWAGVSLT